MKRILVALLAIVVAIAFTGCFTGCQAQAGPNGASVVLGGVLSGVAKGVEQATPYLLTLEAQSALDKAHKDGKINDALYAAGSSLVESAVKDLTDLQNAQAKGDTATAEQISERVGAATAKATVIALTGKMPA